MGQIASFSNVEQSIQANAKLDALMTSTALSQVDGLIGHTITSGDGTISGKITSVRIISGGSVAVLDNGKELLLGEGVKVS
jgi:flagellar basal-body rod modification protein FlgD